MNKKLEILLLVFGIAMMTGSCDRQESKPVVSDRASHSEEKEVPQTSIPEETGSKDALDLPEESDLEEEIDLVEKYSVYRNPIDQYYLPQIYSWDASQVEIRTAEKAYKKAWKTEYKNIMKLLRKKCIYDEDRKNIQALEDNVAAQIKIEKEVIKTEMINAYEVNPDPSQVKDSVSRSSLLGNGTLDRLEFFEGEIYRDVCMRIIHYEEEYEFLFREKEVQY